MIQTRSGKFFYYLLVAIAVLVVLFAGAKLAFGAEQHELFLPINVSGPVTVVCSGGDCGWPPQPLQDGIVSGPPEDTDSCSPGPTVDRCGDKTASPFLRTFTSYSWYCVASNGYWHEHRIYESCNLAPERTP